MTLRNIRWVALLGALTSFVLLVWITVSPAWSADPVPRPFASPPFGQGGTPRLPIRPPAPPSTRAAPSTVNVHPTGRPPLDPQDVPAPAMTPDGVEVGGGLPGGVKSENTVPVFKVNDDTGAGGKAVITDFNYPDADIMDIAKTIGKLTGKNFIFDKNVKGRISIVSNSPITVGDAWKAFLTALDMNGFALIPSGKYIRLARQRDARDKQLSTYIGRDSPNSDALITQVFPLKYISAEEIARTFRSFMPPNARIIPHDQTNTVIVTDTGSNIAKLAKMLEFLDVEGFDAGIEVISVRFASAVEIAKLIDNLLPGNPTGGPGKSRPVGRGSFQARRTKEGGVVNNIIADERTNTLIVHANRSGFQEVTELVKKLDQRLPTVQGGGKIHVMYLQFADAEEVAKTLNNFTTSSTRGTAAPGAATGGTGTNPTTTALFEGSLKVSPDKATNSLVVTASPADFETIKRVISMLDIPRDEVYAEVIIMEMNLGKDFKFSSNLALPNKGITFAPNGDLAEFLTNPVSQKGLILGFKKGNEVEFNIGGQKVKVNEITGLVKALQTTNNANLIATPQILTLDNVEAKFETTERIPVPQSNVTTTGTTTTVTKEDVGLSISIKPQINKVSNYVKLDIKAKLEDIQPRELPAQVANVAFATFARKAETTVVVASEDTVVLGGLIRDKSAKTVSKIPILGDIPILGWLFSSRSEESIKSNLLIFITPTIIRHYEKMRALLDDKLRERDQFIEKQLGGDDGLRDYRDDMIRRLPDIKKLILDSKQAASGMQQDMNSGAEISPGGGDYIEESAPAPTGDNSQNGVPPPPDPFNPGTAPPPPLQAFPSPGGPAGGFPPSMGNPNEFSEPPGAPPPTGDLEF